MALVINDRVKETTTTTGTGTVSLGGAVTGFETFAAGIGNSNTVYYCIAHQDQAEFEVGLGTLDGDSSDLTRTTVISSSNSDSAVDFSSGTKDVFCTIPASKMLFKDASGTIGNFNAATITANTAFVPDASDGAALGTSSLEFSDLFLADGAVINFGDDQDINITHVADTGLTTNGDFSVGDDLTVLGGVIEFKSNSGSPASLKMYCESSNAHFQTLQPQPHSASAANTLRLPNSGDSGTQDLVAVNITQTLTNKTIDSDNNTISNIVNADIKSSAAIADSKLATISTAGKVALSALEIDGGTDIGADLTTSDLIIVDDGAGGTNRKAALSRLTTFMTGQGFSTDDPTALAIALG